MKPIKLSMTAFGPFVEKQEIDFTGLSGEEIFLVTGETGAGKTTIFDAMSFALFGSASGDSRKPATFKSDHAPANELCRVEFLFSLRGHIYDVRRSPAQRGIKRDGSPKDIAPSAELTLPDGGVVTGANAVTERIEQILGLNHRQFKQTIMLAQGEFRQLIEANGKEKQQIFSKIFGTSVYSGLTEGLARAAADLQQITKSSLESISRCIHELAAYGFTALNDAGAVFLPYSQVEAIVNDALSLHKDRISQLDEEISCLEAERAKLNPEQARAMNEKLDRRDELMKKAAELEAAKPEIIETEKRVSLLTASLELEGQEKIILDVKSQAGKYESKLSELETRLDAMTKREQTLLDEIDKPTPESQALGSKLTECERLYASLYRGFLDGQAGILASGLTQGAACPVCGSSHHPSPAVLPDSTPTEKAVNDAKNAVTAASKQLDLYREKVRKAMWQAKTDCEKCASELDSTRAHRESLLSRFKDLRAAFKDKLRQSGFESYSDYQSILSGKSELHSLKQKVDAHRSLAIQVSSRLKELDLDVSGHERADVDSIKKAADEMSRKLAGLRENKTELCGVVAGSKKRLSELERLHGESSENNRKYAVANELASLAKGSRTVSFERYVLAAYFDDIIKLSNIHLQRMTDSRYRLRRLDDSERGAGSGLDMEILDSYTGRSRDVATLSGGESFKASLALALGLSGVVQIYSGGVSIDTMFIDEGFGSLDEKSLDSAVETLISLKKSGRMVGIISHVPALRGYIPKKLAVRYSPTGSQVGWQ